MIEKEAFLRRIGLPADMPVTHTEDFLRKVMYHHVISVPYENLDILDRRPLSLEIPDLYDKIVLRHRGGYCFEVNARLAAFLAEQGFKVTSYFARYLRGESKIPFRRHRIVTVTMEDGAEYMVDIGVGQIAPRLPLKLVEGEVQEQNGETYRFTRDTELGWVLWDLHKGQWRQYVSFTTEMQVEEDFIPASFWCEKHPDSPFNKDNMIAIKTPDGRRTVDGNVYKEFVGETCTHEETMDAARTAQVLDTVFGLR
jgi:N-hydroxyarylamine O-acetyltransferase